MHCLGVAAVVVVLVSVCRVKFVVSHGYLYDPPSRSTMWRHGFPVPANFNDNGLACGGKAVQWGTHGGKCGMCGDPYDGERHNEAGGKYAKGIISRTFTRAQTMPIEVVLTAPHGGWFEFRICPQNDVNTPITQECLDMHLLRLADDPDVTRFLKLPERAQAIKLEYLLPANLTCDHCVLQWKYNTGKDWGCEPIDGNIVCAVGLGPQEQFYGCSDIAIRHHNGTRLSTAGPTTTKPTQITTRLIDPTTTKQTTTTHKAKTTPQSATTTAPKLKTTAKSTPKITPGILVACAGANVFKGTIMDKRCPDWCRKGSCPSMFCNDACRKLQPT